jgi:hypothetical protein
MNKLLFTTLLLLCMGTGHFLYAQSGRVVEIESGPANFNATPPTVTFRVYWLTGPDRTSNHRDSVWVFVDYAEISNGSPLPWAPATLTAATHSGQGSIDASTLSGRGFYVIGTGIQQFSATITVALDGLAGKKFNWCAYATDYPPNATEVVEGHYNLNGTPPFVVNNNVGPQPDPSAKTFTTNECLTAITDATGCPGWVPVAPTVTLAASGSTFCAGDDITLTATGNSSVYQYSFDGGGSWTASSTTVVTATTATTNYTVQVKSLAGCTVSASLPTSVTVNALPVITDFSASPATICAGESSTLTVTTTANASSYNYNGTGWTTSNTYLVTSAITDPTSTTEYTVNVMSSAGCTATIAPATVTVNALPSSISVTPDPAVICAGESSTLSVLATNAASYSYNGEPWTEDNFYVFTSSTDSPSTTTTHTVYVKSGEGCTATVAPATVTVNALPVITGFSASPLTICAGESSTLTVTTTANAASYSYNGDPWVLNNTYVFTPSTDSPSTTTTHTVYVASDQGCTATIAPATVTVNPLPVITGFSASPAVICAGESSTLTVTTSANAASYSYNDEPWTEDNFYVFTSSTDSPSTTTTHTVYVKSGEGCTATIAPATVTVNQLPNPQFVAHSSTACASATITLTATGGGSYCFTQECTACVRNHYLTGNNTDGAADCEVLGTESCSYSATSTYTFTMPESGSVKVWVKVMNEQGCIDSTYTIITVASPTLAWASGGALSQSVQATTAIAPIVFAATNATGVTSVGLPAGVTLSGSGPYTLSGTATAAPGSYPYTLTTTNGNSCTNVSVSGVIIVTAAP